MLSETKLASLLEEACDMLDCMASEDGADREEVEEFIARVYDVLREECNAGGN